MRKFLRVTEVLSIVKEPMYEKLRERHGDEAYGQIMDNARDRGTFLHACFSELLMEGKIVSYGKTDEFMEKVKEYDEAIAVMRKWIKDNVESVVCSEQRYTNNAQGVTGQVDAIVYLFGRENPSIVDLKCNARLTKKTAVQVAGGYVLVTSPRKFESAIALQLKKDRGQWKVKMHEWKNREFPKYQGLFLQALALHRYFYDGEEAKDGADTEDDS